MTIEAFKTLQAIAVPIAQPNLDTDQLLPARYLQKPRSDNFGEYLFKDVRRLLDGSENQSFPLNQSAYRAAKIVVGDKNFGCGSSREHAVWALYDYGIRVVIAESFGDIFYSNALKNSLLPIVLNATAVAELQRLLFATPGTEICVNLENQTVTTSGQAPYQFSIDPFAKSCLLKGIDELDFTLDMKEQIDRFEDDYDKHGPSSAKLFI